MGGVLVLESILTRDWKPKRLIGMGIALAGGLFAEQGCHLKVVRRCGKQIGQLLCIVFGFAQGHEAWIAVGVDADDQCMRVCITGLIV